MDCPNNPRPFTSDDDMLKSYPDIMTPRSAACLYAKSNTTIHIAEIYYCIDAFRPIRNVAAGRAAPESAQNKKVGHIKSKWQDHKPDVRCEQP
jgi:hypothetical protein